MEKDWPPLEECPQYREGLMNAALYKYPWEEDDYAFDFEAFYPPLPDGPPWLLKLLVLTKDMVEPQTDPKRAEKNCPICNPHVDLGIRVNTRTYPGIDQHPVWDMDPIPDPFHILDHFYGPEMYNVRPRLVSPQELMSTKKYLKDLRTSRGYNVDTTPHPGLVYSIDFGKMDLREEFRLSSLNGSTFEDHTRNALYCVLGYIWSKTGKSYELVRILNFVITTPMALVTFTAAAADSAEPETFIASLNSLLPQDPRGILLFGETEPYPSILECLLLPDYDAPYSLRTPALDDF